MSVRFIPALQKYIGLSTDDKSGIAQDGAIIYYVDTEEHERYFNGEWYVYNPNKNNNTSDPAKHNSFNTAFFEQIFAERKTQIAGQFSYDLREGSAIANVTGSGNVEARDSLLILETLQSNPGSVSVQSSENIRYIPAEMSYIFGTLKGLKDAPGSEQLFGIMDENDGFYFGVKDINGIQTFGVGRRRNAGGAGGIDEFIPQNEFNLDKLDGTGKSKYNADFLNSNGNVYCITYGYLGFAPITYYLKKPNDEWIPFHRIEYPNSSQSTNVSIPYLPVRIEVNDPNGVGIELGIGSYNAGTFGSSSTDVTKRDFGYAITTGVSVSGTSYLTAFRNKTTYNGLINKIPSLLRNVSFATDESVKSVTLELILNPTITTDGTWSDIDTYSIVEYSTDTVFDLNTGTHSGLVISLSKDNSSFEIVRDLDIHMTPGDVAVFKVTSSNGLVSSFGIGYSDLF